MRTDWQITVASVLLLLLAALTLESPGLRCPTQSTRNRQARAVRMDDLDGDHNRWHSRGLDNSKASEDSHITGVSFPVDPPGLAAPEAVSAGSVISLESSVPPRGVLKRIRGRAPPSIFSQVI